MIEYRKLSYRNLLQMIYQICLDEGDPWLWQEQGGHKTEQQRSALIYFAAFRKVVVDTIDVVRKRFDSSSPNSTRNKMSVALQRYLLPNQTDDQSSRIDERGKKGKYLNFL